MKISNNTLIHSYQSKSLPTKNPNNKTNFELAAVSGHRNNQSIILDKEKIYDLGTLNGRPFHLKLLSPNGFEWSGRISLSGCPEGKVTPAQKAAARAFDAYTSQEWSQGEHMGIVISTLTNIADNNLETTYFNKRVKLFGISQNEIESALRCLNLDPHKPFSINGQTFIIKGGVLEKYIDRIILENKRRN